MFINWFLALLYIPVFNKKKILLTDKDRFAPTLPELGMRLDIIGFWPLTINVQTISSMIRFKPCWSFALHSIKTLKIFTAINRNLIIEFKIEKVSFSKSFNIFGDNKWFSMVKFLFNFEPNFTCYVIKSIIVRNTQMIRS